MQSSPSTRLVLLAHALCVFQQTTSILVYSMGRAIMEQLPYTVLVFLRLAVVVPLIFTAAAMVTRTIPLPRGGWRDWALIVASAVVSMIGVQSLVFVGISMSSATNASIINAPCTPIFTALFCVIFRIDKMTISKAFGFMFAISGALILLEVEKFSFEGKTLGNLLLALSAVLSAGNSLIQRRLLDRGVHPLIAQGCICLSGMLVFGGAYGPFGLFEESHWQASGRTWLFVGILAIVGTAIPWCTTMYALKIITPMTVNVYVVLQPPMAAVVGVVMMSEVITWRQYVGSALVLLGLVFVNANHFALKAMSILRAKITGKSVHFESEFHKLAQEDPDLESVEMVEQIYTLNGADVVVDQQETSLSLESSVPPDENAMQKIEIEIRSMPDLDLAPSCKTESFVKQPELYVIPTATAVAS